MAGIKTETWVAWIAAVFVVSVGSLFTAMNFAYSTFETMKRADDKYAAFQKQIDRIEDKVDIIGDFPKEQRRPANR